MPACEPLRAARVVADPSVLDALEWPAASLPLRIAPDDVLVIGAAAHQLHVQLSAAGLSAAGLGAAGPVARGRRSDQTCGEYAQADR